ncbi:MAG TPA: S9 family peptidase [Candidatus Limnocylindria bacterium]|nr:S9 family peptidase [Candidatus Limnocylindria bacterium]
MSVDTPRRRPRSFEDDWAFHGTTTPPTTIANPPEMVRPEDLPLRPAPLGGRWSDVPIEDLVGSPYVDHLWGGPDLSPDGREVAFSWDRSGNFEVFVAPLVGERIYQLTDSPQRSAWPRWSPDGAGIAFLRDAGGDERYQIWLMRRDGRRQRALTGEPEVTHREIEWSPDGSRIACASVAAGRASAISVIDVATGERRELTDGSFADEKPRWSPDGRWIAFQSRREDDRTIADIYLVPSGGGAARRLETRNGVAGQSLEVAWSPFGDAIAFSTDVRGRFEIAVARLDERHEVAEVERLTNTPFDSTEPCWRADGRAIRYLHSRDGETSVREVFVASHADHAALDLPGVHKWPRTGPDSATAAVVFSSARRPWDVWVREPRAVRARPITASLPASIDPEVLVEPRHIRYRSSDGREIPAFLYLPHAEAVRGDVTPAIVHIHGGPTSQHFRWWDYHSQWFAHRGYAVLAPNIRGSTGYGREFQEANRGDWGGMDLADVVAGVDWLEREGVAPKGKVGAYGGSYGGFMTLYALAKAPDRFAAGVSVVGVVSWRTLHETTRGDLRLMLERELGDPKKDPELYRDRSPLTHVRSIKAPLLILQGANDPRAPLSEAEAVANALKQEGRTHDYHVYQDEGHGFRQKAHRVDALRRATEWFDKHLRR